MKVTTMLGAELDMSALIARNANKIALGNASMNARGDLLSNGRVVKPREEIAAEYHENPQSVRAVGIKHLASELFSTPAEAVAAAKAQREKLAKAEPAAKNGAHPEPHAKPHGDKPKRKLLDDGEA